jgi:hypothetical protein
VLGQRLRPLLRPAAVREFAALAGIAESKDRKAIEASCVLAMTTWPQIICEGDLPPPWVHQLRDRLDNQPQTRSSIRTASERAQQLCLRQVDCMICARNQDCKMPA